MLEVVNKREMKEFRFSSVDEYKNMVQLLHPLGWRTVDIRHMKNGPIPELWVEFTKYEIGKEVIDDGGLLSDGGCGSYKYRGSVGWNTHNKSKKFKGDK